MPVDIEDLREFPLVSRGHRLEAFTVGRTYSHHWGRTLTQADNILFSTATCNWNPLFLNESYARGQGHPATVINPMLVLCTAVGLSVEDLSERGGPFLGLDDCEFVQTVYPGDTLTAASEVVSTRRSESRPHHGIVTWRTEAANQRDEIVLRYTRSNLVTSELAP